MAQFCELAGKMTNCTENCDACLRDEAPIKVKTMTIYDYKDSKKVITLPDKEIARIYVTILSGDETVKVEFADGETMNFDASDSRLLAYLDGDYIVEGDDIAAWLNFVPTNKYTVSYERYEFFTGGRQ